MNQDLYPIKNLMCPKCGEHINPNSGGMRNNEYECPSCETFFVISNDKKIHVISVPKALSIIKDMLVAVSFVCVVFSFLCIFEVLDFEIKIAVIPLLITWALMVLVEIVKGYKYGVTDIPVRGSGNLYKAFYPKSYKYMMLISLVFFFGLLYMIYLYLTDFASILN